MYKWRVSYFGKTGQTLGTVEATNEASARKEAIEFYDIEPAQQFRVVAVKLGKIKESHPLQVAAPPAASTPIARHVTRPVVGGTRNRPGLARQ